jgi:FtsP/CotA-like multicopper oxidase with cupredoxin domain
MDRRQRLALLGVAVVIAAVAIVIAVASGGGDDNSKGTTAAPTQAADTTQQQQQTTTTDAAPQPVVEQIVVKGGQPDGGLKKISVKKGERVEIDVTADEADEAHLHGYDIEKELQPGKAAKFRFTADLEGVFELELHHAGTQLAKITVRP